MHPVNQFALAVGYLVITLGISYLGWHVIAWLKRYRAGREQRFSQRVYKKVESEEVPEELNRYGDVPLGT